MSVVGDRFSYPINKNFEHLNHRFQIRDAMNKSVFFIGFILFVLLICPTVTAYHDQATQYYNEGLNSAKIGQYSEALISFDKVVAINPNDADTWYNRGVVLYNLNMYTEAVDSYDKALAINPDYADAWSNRGNALDNLALYSEAVRSYDKALAINPNDAETWYDRGFALGKLGEFSKAVTSYDKALAINPNYADAWRNRGVALGDLALYSEAVGSYYKAITSYYKAIVPDTNNTSVKQNPESEIKTQTQPAPLLYSPICAIVLMAGIAVWGRHRNPSIK